MKKKLSVILTIAFALAFIVSLQVQAGSNTNMSPWYPIGMGGNGYLNAIDISEVPGTNNYNIVTGLDAAGIWLSFDKGDSWVPAGGENIGLPIGSYDIANAVAFDPNDVERKSVFVAMASSKIMKGSVIEGKYVLATKYTADQSFSAIGVSPSNPQVVYAGAGKIRPMLNTGYTPGKNYLAFIPKIHKSTDGGESWAEVSTLPLGDGYTKATVISITVHPTDPDIVYAVCDKGLFKSTDGASTWTQLGIKCNNPLPHNATYGFAIDPSNTNTMYVTLMPYPNIQEYTLQPDLYTSQNVGGVFKSIDGGVNWTKLNVGFTPPAGLWHNQAGCFYDVKISSKNGNRVYVAYQQAYNNAKSGVLRSIDGGSNWTLLNNFEGTFNNLFGPQLLGIYSIDSSTDDIYVLGKKAGQFKSNDNGASFVNLTSSRKIVDGVTSYRGWGMELPLGFTISVDKSNPNVLFYTENDRGIWRSKDGGLSYEHVYEPNLGTQDGGSSCIIDPDNSNVVYAGFANKQTGVVKSRNAPHFIKSTDGGSTWIDNVMSGVVENYINDIVLDPTTLAPENVSSQRVIYVAATDDAWYDIRLVFDTNRKIFDVYVEGNLVADDYNFIDSNADSLNKIQFNIPNTSTGTFYFDSVAVSDVNQAVIFDEFEDDVTGFNPSGWTISTSGTGSATVEEIENTSGKSVKVYSPNTDDLVNAIRTFSDTTGIINLNYKVRAEETSGWKAACIIKDENYTVASIAIQNNYVKVLNGTVWDNVTGFEAASTHTGIYKSTDGGSTWSNFQSGIPAGAYIKRMAIDPNDTSILYAADMTSFGGVFKKNGLNNWNKVFDYNTEAVAVAKDGLNSIIYAGCNDLNYHGIYKSTDGGTTWTRVYDSTQSIPDFWYRDIEVVGNNEVIVATSMGVLRTTDQGTTWSNFDENITFNYNQRISTNETSRGTSYFTGMNCAGVAKRTTLPFTVVEYKRNSSDYFMCYAREAMDGMQSYPDAAWQIKNIPSELGILKNLYNFTTSNLDKDNSTSSLHTLKLDCLSNVYVAVPYGANPSWLSSNGFVKSSTTFDMYYRETAVTKTMDIWKKSSVQPGTLVILGGLKNNNIVGDVQYLVFAEKIEMLLQDNFDDGDSKGWTVATGSLSVITDGVNKAYKSGHNDRTDSAFTGEVTWDNYIAETKVKVDSWSGSVGLKGRYADENNFYELIYASQTQELIIQKKINGTVTRLVTTSFSRPSTGEYHSFRLILDNNVLKGYVDGELKLTAIDNDLTSGKIAVRSWCQYAYFDDISVSR